MMEFLENFSKAKCSSESASRSTFTETSKFSQGVILFFGSANRTKVDHDEHSNPVESTMMTIADLV